MSRKHKFHNKEGLYFVSFAVVYWADVFIREEYCTLFLETLKFYQEERLDLFAYCIMTSHVHLIFSDKLKEPDKLLGNIKRYSSRKIREAIENNPKESRNDWLLWIMERAANKTGNVHQRMFWQHHNQPIELWSPDVILQKLNYIHQNPVVAGYVTEPQHWKYSSAYDYSGGKGLIDVNFLF